MSDKRDPNKPVNPNDPIATQHPDLVTSQDGPRSRIEEAKAKPGSRPFLIGGIIIVAILAVVLLGGLFGEVAEEPGVADTGGEVGADLPTTTDPTPELYAEPADPAPAEESTPAETAPATDGTTETEQPAQQ